MKLILKNLISPVNFLLIIICILFSTHLSACSTTISSPTPSTNIGDGGFLSGNPCSAPCFHNITPGVTTEKQALEILSLELDIKNCDRWEKNNNGVNRGISCSNIGITFDDSNLVNVVSFRPTQIITIGEVIKKYGNPDAILVTSINPSNKQIGTVNMMVYYDSLNLNISLADQNSGEFELKPTTLIGNIGYSDQNSYKLKRRYFQKWNGYGLYKQFNP
ncbi:MAG: hypothetical protein NTW32_27260 [Chloroflexi bacterium]|nr:hypothetical protein [Chloroflexota bacterium]